MRQVVIDTDRCSGNGRCYTLLPDLFADDERGHGVVLGNGILRADQHESAQRAVIACPEDAIRIEEVSSGGRGGPHGERR